MTEPGVLTSAAGGTAPPGGRIHFGWLARGGVAVTATRRLILYGAASDRGPGAGMAQQITVALEDDLEGGPADETVRFGLASISYEIDLSAKNAAAFRKQLAPFIEHARRTAGGQSRRAWRTASSRERARPSGRG